MSLQKEFLKIKEDSEKYGTNQAYKILQLLKRNQDDVLNKISRLIMKYSSGEELKISDYQRYTLLSELERQLNDGIKTLSDKQTLITYDILTDVYQQVYYSTAYTIEKGIQTSVNFQLLRPEFVKAAVERPIQGKNFSNRIWTNTNDLAKRVRTTTEKSLVQGVSPEKLAREVKREFGSTAYQAKRLVYNETARSVMSAQDEIFQNSDVIKEVIFDATLDDKTSEICQSLDGKHFPKDNYPSIPDDTHVGCRSCIIPVIEGWKPTKKRENVVGADGTKKIIDYTDVNTWKKTRLEGE